VIVTVTLQERISTFLQDNPGSTDRQIANELLGPEKHQSPVNIGCRRLEAKGIIARKKRDDGKIGNYPSGQIPPINNIEASKISDEGLSEDDIKKVLELYLKKLGWSVKVAYGGQHGIDIDAIRGESRWIIEVKGPGSRNEMRVNYFIGILGELLQRMSDPNAKYSIALPDMEQFHRLWARLPGLAKERTGITILFVDKSGMFHEVK
jgi:hypothetical protein